MSTVRVFAGPEASRSGSGAGDHMTAAKRSQSIDESSEQNARFSIAPRLCVCFVQEKSFDAARGKGMADVAA